MLQLSNLLIVLPDLLLVVLDVTLQALDRDLASALVRVQIPLPLLQFLKLLSNSTRRADSLMSLDYVFRDGSELISRLRRRLTSERKEKRNSLSERALTRGYRLIVRLLRSQIHLNALLEARDHGILPGRLLTKLISLHLELHHPLVPRSHDALHFLQLNGPGRR